MRGIVIKIQLNRSFKSNFCNHILYFKYNSFLSWVFDRTKFSYDLIPLRPRANTLVLPCGKVISQTSFKAVPMRVTSGIFTDRLPFHTLLFMLFYNMLLSYELEEGWC